jgi:hypothetical protein
MASLTNVVSLSDYRHRRAPTPRRLQRSTPWHFGRRRPLAAAAEPVPASRIGDDLRLFAATFAAGFLFVSVMIV